MEIEPGVEEMAFIAAFLNEGMRKGNFCALILYDMPPEIAIDKLTEFGVNVRQALDSGSLVIADLWGEGKYDPEKRGPILITENPGDPSSSLRLYYDLEEINERNQKSGKYAGCRVIIHSLSSEVMNYKFEQTYKLARKGIYLNRKWDAIALTTINPGMFEETVVAAFEHLYDGIIALNMKEEKGKLQRYFRVKQSPLAGFFTDGVPYEIVDHGPSLLTPLADSTVFFKDHAKFNADGSITMTGTRFILANIMFPNAILDQGVKMLGYDVIAQMVYDVFKRIGEVEIEAVFSSLNIKPSISDVRQTLRLYASYLSNIGLGIAELVSYTNEVVTFRLRNTLCSQYQQSDKPMAPYLAGAVAGAVGVILGKPVKCKETRCMAKGDDYCEFDCRVTAR
jgi:predicted hydrocarbon binding protein/KaiC/GvpD/RAD55 family RecA-like ATPase